jgi:hypothetical protein
MSGRGFVLLPGSILSRRPAARPRSNRALLLRSSNETVDRDALADADALAVRRCIDLLQFDLAAQHPLLPGPVLRFHRVELRHDLLGEKFETFAYVIMAVSAGLVQQDDAVNFRLGEPVQLAADRFRRAVTFFQFALTYYSGSCNRERAAPGTAS